MKVVYVKASVELPRLPNYLLPGVEGGLKLDVADVSDEGLREIGAAWTEALVAHAQERRKARKSQGTSTDCPECSGEGTCSNCDGAGFFDTFDAEDSEVECSVCDGTGFCQKCDS